MVAVSDVGERSGWLKRRSINQRLGLQSGAAVLIGCCLVATTVGGSLISIGMIEKDNRIAGEALHAALLEKDFASLERDVFRHALLNNDDTRKDYEGNVADLQTSIADTRRYLEPDEARKADTVQSKAEAYVKTVNATLAQGVPNAGAVSRIMDAGDQVDGEIEGIREPVIRKSVAVSVAQVRLTRIILVLTVAIAILAGALAYMLSRAVRRTISGELEGLRDSIARIESGRFDVAVADTERTDDIGELARAIERLRDTTRAKQQSDAETSTMIATLGDRLRDLANGDLTIELPELGTSYEAVRSDFNRTVEQLRDAMRSVAESADAIRVGSAEINSASEDLAQRTEHHAAELSEVADSVSALSRSLSETAGSAADANSGAQDAVEVAREGGDVMRQAAEAMATIEKSTAEIGNIISVIDSITFQTNLLALNAGVEAARAGEAGSGFAVVASEVRSLAQRSADAAHEVRQLINSSSGQVAQGVDMVRRMGGSLECIIDRVQNVSRMVTQISEAASRQSALLQESNAKITGIDHMTQQNAAMAEQSTAAAQNLATEADTLSGLVTAFTVEAGGNRSTHSRGAAVAGGARRQPRLAIPKAAGGHAALALVPDSDWSEF